MYLTHFGLWASYRARTLYPGALVAPGPSTVSIDFAEMCVAETELVERKGNPRAAARRSLAGPGGL